MLFDSHAHLDSEKFDGERDKIVENAKQAGLKFILNPAADFKTSLGAIEVANKYDMVYAAVGVHPHDADTLDDKMIDDLRELAKHPKVMAIGEIGLDYYYDNSPRELQKQAFIKQIRLAKELKLPIIIHDRDSHEDVFNILKAENPFDTGVVLHCYSSSAELAKEYIKLGAYISIAGPLTFKNNKKTPEVVKEVPLDRLFIETDSPYLTPTPFRGKRNEPAYVRYVAEKIAEIKGVSFDEVARTTRENACKFFGIECF